MTPQEFIARWRDARLTERAAAQSHFIELCRLIDEPTPVEQDLDGSWYTFEKGLKKAGGTDGYADVWKRRQFAWEYKGPRKSLDQAFEQLAQYHADLENPPLHVACDTRLIRVRTMITGEPSREAAIALEDLEDWQARRTLKWVFTDWDRFRAGETREAITAKAAESFGAIARKLRAAGHEPQAVAHFVNRLVFCMVAEDIGLLPEGFFLGMIREARRRPSDFPGMARQLFGAMASRDGMVGFTRIPWFNGGLFDDDTVLPLDADDLRLVEQAADLDWSRIEPSIFGTLFERGLDPDKRSQLGAHYTDPDKIMKIVEPVVLRPLARDWDAVKQTVREEQAKKAAAKAPAARTRAENRARDAYRAFRDRLARFRVLDPACGSGNFLYLALLGLKDFELKVALEAQDLGLPLEFPRVGPEAVRGIEINPYAAELARLTVWIGQIQWQLKKGFGLSRDPILKPLDQIECRDALLNPDGTEAAWPEADAIVGNPPFLGGKRMRDLLGGAYVDRLFAAYLGRVPAEADLVCYWFAKARPAAMAGGVCAGLVATNSIRGGANRAVVRAIATEGVIYDAWDDEPWVLDGAAVRVSMLCFGRVEENPVIRFDGEPVERINADLTTGALDLTQAKRLPENRGVCFMGDTKGGAFDIPGDLARQWLALPLNPNGRPNADVLKPWMNGMDITRRPADKWIIDFGWQMGEAQASFYEAPFDHVAEHVRPARAKNRREAYRDYWWRHVEPRPGMWLKLRPLGRFIATPTVAKHRLFLFASDGVCPDHQLIAIARDDDTTFGILHSRFHEAWALRMGTSLEDRPRYTPTTTFETFPFPDGLTPDLPAAAYADDPRARAIAAAARALDEAREAWLNPPDLVRREPEVVPGYPDRLLPVSDAAATELKKRTLTNLYNARPAWLDHLHRALDAAVARAYGWPEDIAEDDALARLFALNQSRGASIEHS